MSDKKQYRVLKPIFAYGDQQLKGAIVALTADEANEAGLDRLELMEPEAAQAAAPAKAGDEQAQPQDGAAADGDKPKEGEQQAAQGDAQSGAADEGGADKDKEDLSDL